MTAATPMHMAAPGPGSREPWAWSSLSHFYSGRGSTIEPRNLTTFFSTRPRAARSTKTHGGSSPCLTACASALASRGSRPIVSVISWPRGSRIRAKLRPSKFKTSWVTRTFPPPNATCTNSTLTGAFPPSSTTPKAHFPTRSNRKSNRESGQNRTTDRATKKSPAISDGADPISSCSF